MKFDVREKELNLQSTEAQACHVNVFTRPFLICLNILWEYSCYIVNSHCSKYLTKKQFNAKEPISGLHIGWHNTYVALEGNANYFNETYRQEGKMVQIKVKNLSPSDKINNKCPMMEQDCSLNMFM